MSWENRPVTRGPLSPVVVCEAHELLEVRHREAVARRVAGVDEDQRTDRDTVPPRLGQSVLHRLQVQAPCLINKQ